MKLHDAWSNLKSMRCSTVEISGSSISQLDGGTVVAIVPKEEIQEVTLVHDSQSRYPFLRFLTGFVLILFGLILFTNAFLKAEGGVVLLHIKSFTLGIPVIPILLSGLIGGGIWLIRGVFRGRFNFYIKSVNGDRKIFFEEATDVIEIRDFVGRAVSEFGYEIDATLFDTMHFGNAPRKRITIS
jgi:hypothetical protein